ncbi:DUF5659 domain-containing protein [Anaerovorax odorimutans]|uniref:DUF5659 domain-containing protein n=1 Tax=Anaerovorax odorimutans TaxID=109327 RepID=UPI00048905F9|nr:DUF5659 domain-containing protein [Anaerovorax odorimutans]
MINKEVGYSLNNKNSRTFPVYKQKLAGYLMQEGFVLVDIAPNTKTPNRNVFYFRDTPQIKLSIQNFLNRK